MTVYTKEMYTPMAAADYATGINQRVTITYAAPRRGLRHVISGVAWSFSAAPASTLTIMDGATVVFSVDLTESGYHSVQFDPPKCGSPSTSLAIVLDAAGGAVTSKLNVLGHWVDFQPPSTGATLPGELSRFLLKWAEYMIYVLKTS